MAGVPVLDMPEIIKLSGSNMRPFVEGSEVTQHGIISIGETKSDGENFASGPDIIKVFSLVMQCSGTAKVPHVVKISVQRGTPNKVVKWWCSCTGGNGRCKHTLAVAFRLFRLTEETLEPISCTDTTQGWGKAKLQKWSDSHFKGTALEEMCHFKQKAPSKPIIMPHRFGNSVKDLFRKEGDLKSEFNRFSGMKRCTAMRKPDTTIHKSVVRALRKVTTCPLKIAVIPQKGKNAGKPRAVNSAGPSPNRNKENRFGVESATETKAPRTYSRRPLGNIQPPSQNNLVHNTTPPTQLNEHFPGETSSLPDLLTTPANPHNSARTRGRQLFGAEENFMSFLQALGTLEESPTRRIEECNISPASQQTPYYDIETPTVSEAIHSTQGTVSANHTGIPHREVRRELWRNISAQRPSLPPPTLASVGMIDSLLRKPLLVPVKSAPQFNNADDEQYFLGKVCVTPEDAKDLCLSSLSQSSSNVWGKERKKRFTASGCYKLFTPQAAIEDDVFWKRKLQGVLNDSFGGNFNTRRGLEDEPYARRRYEEIYKTTVSMVGLVVHPEAPWFGCSPDGIVEGRILFETKSPECGIISPARDILPTLSFIKKDQDGHPHLNNRHPYYGQVQLGMALTGLQICHFVVYSSFDDSIAKVEVPFDRVFVSALLEKLTALYFRYHLGIIRQQNPAQS